MDSLLHSRPTGFLPQPYEGETLYSLIARYGAQTGYRTANQAFFDLIGGRQRRPVHDFPFHLDAIAAGIPSRFSLDAERIFDRHTLAPYYLFRAPPATRAAALAAAKGQEGKVARIVGAHSRPIGPITHLRFCPACLKAMEDADQDLHWLRAHQLPIASHCVIHSEPLRVSLVEVGVEDFRLHRASRARCPDDAPAIAASTETDQALLLDISRRAVGVLEGDDTICQLAPEGDDVAFSKALAAEFVARGFELGMGKIVWSSLEAGIAPIVDGIGCVHAAVPRAGRSHNGWLRRLLDGGRSVGTDAVVLAMAILDRLPKIPPPFGTGPWECVNPLADHYGDAVVTELRRLQIGSGMIRGWFDCDCGCGYTRVCNPDGGLGRPMVRHYGPLLEPFILRCSKAGWSIKKTARELGTDSIVVVRMVGDDRIPHSWDAASFADRYARVRKPRGVDG